MLREQLGKRLADEAGADFDSEMPEVAAQKKPVNPKLRAAAPGKTAGHGTRPASRAASPASASRTTTPRHTPPLPATRRRVRIVPAAAPKRAPKLVEERERDVRVVHFDDGTEGEHEVKYQRPAAKSAAGIPRTARPPISAARPTRIPRPASRAKKARKTVRARASVTNPAFGDKQVWRPPHGLRFGDRPPRDGDRKPFGAKKFTDKPGFGNRGRARAAGEGDDQRPAARSFTSRTRSARPFDDAGAPRKSFGDKPFGDRKPFNRGPREDGDRPARKFGDKPAFGKKPYAPRGDAGDRPARPYGDKKPYTPRGDGDRPARTYTAGTKPSYGDKKPYAPRGDGGARPPREGGDRPARSYTAGTKPSYGDKKPYAPRGDGGARPPREGGDRPARTYTAGSKPAYGGKPRAAGPGKPYAGKPGGARPAGGARPDGGHALNIRLVDAGSCNGCEQELHALNNAYYNLEGLGIRFVASPRHADMLLVTGPVSRHMEVALRRTFDAMPDPKLVVAIGDCAFDGGIFAADPLGASYASCGQVANIIPVDVVVQGCPPTPVLILQGILTAITGNHAIQE